MIQRNEIDLMWKLWSSGECKAEAAKAGSVAKSIDVTSVVG